MRRKHVDFIHYVQIDQYYVACLRTFPAAVHAATIVHDANNMRVLGVILRVVVAHHVRVVVQGVGVPAAVVHQVDSTVFLQHAIVCCIRIPAVELFTRCKQFLRTCR